MIITREKGMRMWGGGSGSTSASGVNGGGGFSLAVTEGEGTGNAYTDFTYESGTLTLNKGSEFVTVDFFNKLFTAYDANGNVIAPNNTTPTLDNIKFKAGAWTEQYLSALGQNSSGGGGGGGIELSDVWQSLKTNTDDYANQKINSAHIPDLSGTYATKTWVNQQGFVTSSGVTSVAMTVPTGLSVSGSPITSTGTLALAFASGYSIPTTAKQGNWDTAFGWGNHATAGYASESSVTTLQGYFTNGVANTAAKLNTGTTTYTAWGQTYWSSGVPQSISGNMTSVGSITPSANGNYLGTSSARFNIHGTSGSFSSDVLVAGTLGVTGATTLTGLLTANGGIVVPSAKTIKIGDCTISWDSTNSMLKFDTGIYSTGAVSALGANSSGGGSGTFDEEAMWEALGTTITAKVIASSHIPTLANYVTNVAISGNYLRVTKNGSNSDLTIPYATSAECLNYYQVSDPNTAYKDHVVKWFSQISGNSGYAGTNYGFPVSSNANGILWLGTHNGNYGGQIGISSNGNIYYRYTSSGNFSTAANGGSWHTILHSNNTYVSSGKGYINGTEITTISGNAATATKATQDGDGRTITSTYLPLSGGTMSGTLKWISAALPQTTSPNYLLTIDSFADGGTTKWALLSNVLVGKATTLATPRTIWGQSFDGSSNVSGALTGVTTIHMTNNLTLAAGSDGIYLSNNGIRLHNSSNTYKTDALTFDLDNGNATFHHALAVNYASSYPFAIRRFESSTEQLEISVLDVSVKFNASDADGWSNFLFCSNGTEFVRFNGYNKCVGIGTNAPSQKLHVSGNILASGEVTASSDERKKNIISNTKFNVKDIASARSIIYEWNDDRDNVCKKKIHGGSIAQDWLGKADDFLSQDNDGFYSINYGALALCSAITIAKEVVKHEDRITLLEKENARLKARVEELEERRIA